MISSSDLRERAERLMGRSPAHPVLEGSRETSSSRGERPARSPLRRRQWTRLVATLQQRRLWVAEQTRPEAVCDRIAWTLRIEGPLDVGVLERAFFEVVRRHDALRTRFVASDFDAISDPRPLQIVDEARPEPIEVADLGALARGAREDEASRILGAWATQRFDLARGPLVRARIVRLAPDEHLLALSLHRTVADEWSCALVLAELATCYESFVAGRPSPLPEPAFQYGDYATWQFALARGRDGQAHVDYWRRRLDGARARATLVESLHGAGSDGGESLRVPLDLDGGLAERLDALGREHGGALATTLLAAMQTCLERASGEDGALVFTTETGRSLSGSESIVGPFESATALRTSLAGDPTFRELMARATQTVREAGEHREITSEMALGVSRFDGEALGSRNPHVALSMRTERFEPLEAGGLVWRMEPAAFSPLSADLTLRIVRRHDGADAELAFDSGLLAPSRVRVMASHFRSLLEAVAADPDRRLSTLETPWMAPPLHAAIPRLALGGRRPAALGEASAPRDALERTLVRFWEYTLETRPVGVADDFFALGGTWLAAMRLFARIENACGVSLPPRTILLAPTVEQLAALLRETEAPEPWRSLIPLRRGGTRPPLFCIHAGTANVLIYRSLVRHLDGDQPVYALQAVGIDGEREPLDRVEAMAAHYVEEIRSVQPSDPYTLLGASFGGLVAFEMACRLRERGDEVAFVGMLNTDGPVGRFERRVRAQLSNLVYGGPVAFARTVVDRVRGRIGRSAGGDPSGSEEEGALVLPRDPALRATRAAWRASKRYRPVEKVYPGKLTYFLADDRHTRTPITETYQRWTSRAAGGLEVHRVPGNHGSMREEPHVAVLAREVTACLTASQDRAR